MRPRKQQVDGRDDPGCETLVRMLAAASVLLGCGGPSVMASGPDDLDGRVRWLVEQIGQRGEHITEAEARRAYAIRAELESDPRVPSHQIVRIDNAIERALGEEALGCETSMDGPVLALMRRHLIEDGVLPETLYVDTALATPCSAPFFGGRHALVASSEASQGLRRGVVFGVFLEVVVLANETDALPCQATTDAFGRGERACITVTSIGITGDGVGMNCSLARSDGQWRVMECVRAFDI